MKRTDVILPFHRDDSYLHKAVESVIRSKHAKIRLILVDDRPDQTNAISFAIEKGTDVKYTSTLGGQGYGSALKAGSDCLDSDYVALMNSDDLVDENRFWYQEDLLKGCDLNFTGLRRENSRGSNSRSIAGDLKFGAYDPSFLYLGAYGANASWFTTQGWWVENTFFDARPALDWRIALTAFSNSEVRYLHQPLYTYRRHRLQTTASSSEAQALSGVYELWSRKFQAEFGHFASQNVFGIMATPWLKSINANWVELEIFMRCLNSNIKGKSTALANQANYLLNRRLAIYFARNPLFFKEMPWSIKKQIPFSVISLLGDVLTK